jgi:hypothetical protein
MDFRSTPPPVASIRLVCRTQNPQVRVVCLNYVIELRERDGRIWFDLVSFAGVGGHRMRPWALITLCEFGRPIC